MKTFLDKIMPYRNHILAFLVFAVVVGVAWGVSRSPAESASLKVAWKEGDVVFSVSGQAWEFADVGTRLTTDSMIRTGEKGKAMLQTPNGDMIRMGGNTELKISSVGDSSTLVSQNSGRTYYRVRTAQSTLFQISALGNTIKATGTALDVSVNAKDQRINAKVLDGKIDVTIANDATDGPQTVGKGQEITVSAKGDPRFTLANIGNDYANSDWLKWNKAEDLKLGYELDLEASAAAIGDAPLTNGTTQPSKTTVKSTTTQPKASTYVAGTCRPSLSAKTGLGGMGIQLNWTPCKNDDFQFYKLVRSTTNPNLSYPSTPALVTSSNKFFGSYLDKNLAIGQTYYYRVCVVERLGQIGCGNVAKMAN